MRAPQFGKVTSVCNYKKECQDVYGETILYVNEQHMVERGVSLHQAFGLWYYVLHVNKDKCDLNFLIVRFVGRIGRTISHKINLLKKNEIECV